MKHTFKTVRAELALLGISVKKTGYGNELLVRIKGSPKGEGSFCDGDDMQGVYWDAMATGKAMARHGFATLI